MRTGLCGGFSILTAHTGLTLSTLGKPWALRAISCATPTRKARSCHLIAWFRWGTFGVWSVWSGLK